MKTIIFTVRRSRRNPLRVPLLCTNYYQTTWRGIPVLAVEHPLAVNFPFQKVACYCFGDPPVVAFFSAFDVARVEGGRCVPAFPGNS